MKKGFVQTENFRRLKEAEKLVSKRGAKEAGLVIVRGVFGVGKSELTERWAADGRYVFVRAKETWTKRALLDELAERMGLEKRGRNQEVQSRIIGKMAVDMVPLVIDEADFLIRSTASLLEVVRDITDVTGTMCFLVGMEQFPSRVQRYPHIMSRVAKVVDFDMLSLADVRATVTQKCEVAVEPEAIEELHRQARGRMRLVLNAICNVEQLATANSWKSVGLKEIDGRPLCSEFTGTTLGKLRGMA